jgi:hypothetical protein
LAGTGRRARPKQPRTSPLPRGGTSCRLQVAACSPVTEDVAGRGEDPAVGAGRLLAGTDDSPELSSSWALRLPASWLNERWGTLPAAGMVLGISADTIGFFLRDSAILNSLSTPAET